MSPLTDFGQSQINDLSQRYNLSVDAVMHMLQSVINGNGTMAQFHCPELGGSGQWMQGGMTMVSDMFNYGLQNTVNNLCSELANLYAGNELLFQAATPLQTQYQSNSNNLSMDNWPQSLGLGNPSSSGAQNGLRYAVFPSFARLAVETNGQTTLYDTLDHQITGVSQQQGSNDSLTFSSQYGTLFVHQLPVVSFNGLMATPSPVTGPTNFAQVETEMSLPASDDPILEASSDHQEIIQLIEQLSQLQQQGILTDSEFSAKKSELLKRL